MSNDESSSAAALDTTVVELHRVPSEGLQVTEVEGSVWHMVDIDRTGGPVQNGDRVSAGHIVGVASEAWTQVGDMRLSGGRFGCVHSFVGPDAFVSAPSRQDVPRLLRELGQLQEQVDGAIGQDPLAMHPGPETDLERAMSRDFALSNLIHEVAVELPEEAAISLESVCLFYSGEAACVAMLRLSIHRIAELMRALGRPINPHLVDRRTLFELHQRVYQQG